MMWRALVVLTVLTGALPDTAAAYSLVVRTYDKYGLSNDDLLVARAQAEVIFKDAGIELAWMDCWSEHELPPETPVECQQEPRVNEIVLRLLRSNHGPDAQSRSLSMGYSLVNTPERQPFLATVFVDLVAYVARNARADSSKLLGRAVAHEIGHLLLNENRHAATGLMRAIWSRRDLRRDKASDWKFRADEVEMIRRAVHERYTSALW
jgi:hypothetical protein